MADFIKLDDDTGDTAGVGDTTPTDRSDPIARYLDSVVDDGDKSEENKDAGAEGGEKQEDAKQLTDVKSGDGSDKDGKSQSKPNEAGEKDKGSGSAAKPGDLVENGVVVARAGAERRHYEKAKLAESQLSMRSNELKQANDSRERLQNELNTLRNTVQSLNGADPQHLATGVKLVRDLQRDPAGTLKTLLTEAMAAGYTVEGIGAGIDTNSIRQAMMQQIEPLLTAQQQNEQQTQQAQALEQEVTQFYSSHPDALVHDEVIAAVISKNPQMPLSDAYFQLRNSVIDRGLDWSKPLAPQMQDTSEQNKQQQPQQKPMPNGRGPSGQTQLANADRTVVAHESTSSGDIVKAAMREAGLKI